jgi:hypothetical protein
MTTKAFEEASKLIADALHGDRGAQGLMKGLLTGSSYLQESISTSDLLKTFKTVTTAAVLKQYALTPKVWTDFARKNLMNDFKPATFRELIADWSGLPATNGGEATAPDSLPNVPELTEYPTISWGVGEAQTSLSKKGARAPFSWESVINDEWNVLEALPTYLGQLASNTEDTQATLQLVASTGPNPVTFSAGNGNAADTKNLTLDNLAAAQQAVLNRKVNGRYIEVSRWRLVVPPQQELLAKQILATTEIFTEVTNGSTVSRTKTQVPLSGNISLTVNPWLTRIDVSANAARTWYLVPDGGDDGTRTALVVNFLRGYEAPEFRVSGDTGLYLGGGAVPALEGNFNFDDIQYRVRHVTSGATIKPQALYASAPTSGV